MSHNTHVNVSRHTPDLETRWEWSVTYYQHGVNEWRHTSELFTQHNIWRSHVTGNGARRTVSMERVKVTRRHHDAATAGPFARSHQGMLPSCHIYESCTGMGHVSHVRFPSLPTRHLAQPTQDLSYSSHTHESCHMYASFHTRESCDGCASWTLQRQDVWRGRTKVWHVLCTHLWVMPLIWDMWRIGIIWHVWHVRDLNWWHFHTSRTP